MCAHIAKCGKISKEIIMNKYKNLHAIDPSKLDFSLDVRDLSREIIITIRVLDDATFKVVSKEALELRDDIKTEMAKQNPTN